MMIVKSRVRRDGQVIEIPAEQIVPGDIVLLEAGDRVTADGRIIRAATLEIGESALTGESAPVPKEVAPVDQVDTPLGDRVDMAYMNTEVTRGAGDILVTATGMATEVGHISGMLQTTKLEKTPLTKQLDTLTNQIIVIALVALALFLALGYFRNGQDVNTLLLAGVAFAHLGYSDRSACGRHLPAGERHNGSGENRRHCEATALGRDARRNLGHQLGQDGHPDPQPDDGRRAGDPRPAVHDHWRRLLDGRPGHPCGWQAQHRPRTLLFADGAGL